MKDISFAELCDRWSSFVPPAVAASTWPRLLTQTGALLIETAGPWTEELSRRSAEILDGLPTIDGNHVERLSFRYVPPVKEATRDRVHPYARPRRGAKKKGR